MTPGEIRTELLGQHAAMRAMIDRAAALIARVRGGETAHAELRATLDALTEATRVHNEREETLLREIISTVDAWGPARASVMDEQHRLEHQALHAALQWEVDDDASCAATEALLARMLRHMDREEEAFLSEKVLRDDAVITDYFGG